MEILLSIQSKADGNVREVRTEIGSGLPVGRGAETGVLLDGNDLSREHLVLTSDGTSVYVTDHSSNGTWLNGSRLQKSVRTRMRFEDAIDVPGYTMRIRSTEPPKEQMVVAPQSPLAVAAVESVPEPQPEESGPLAMLAPVKRFIDSITFAEKFFFLMGVCGLAWLYAYMK
jgi:predicted component of type VI protein secretion system